MPHNDLAKLFNRFKKEELLELLTERGLVKEGAVNLVGSKKSLIDRVLRICERDVTKRNIALIDLFCKYFLSSGCAAILICGGLDHW